MQGPTKNTGKTAPTHVVVLVLITAFVLGMLIATALLTPALAAPEYGVQQSAADTI